MSGDTWAVIERRKRPRREPVNSRLLRHGRYHICTCDVEERERGRGETTFGFARVVMGLGGWTGCERWALAAHLL